MREGQKYDIVCYSVELKKLVRGRLLKQEHSLIEVCKKEKLIYEDIQTWLYEEPTIYNIHTQLQVIKLAQYLGIDIRLTFTVNENIEA